MMVPRQRLSDAIRAGAEIAPKTLKGRYIGEPQTSCPLGAAFLGSLDGAVVVHRFQVRALKDSPEYISTHIHGSLMKTFPQLRCSVRDFPRLFKTLRQDCPGALRNGKYKSGGYTLTLYSSLFIVITRLHDEYDWSKQRIAELLAEAGL